MKKDKIIETIDIFKNNLDIEKWYETNDKNPWNIYFPDFMWQQGYKMDCYNSYYDLFENTYMHNDITQVEYEDIILTNLEKCHSSIVGNYIFSRYRYLTHWCDYGYPTEACTYFFPKAFDI